MTKNTTPMTLPVWKDKYDKLGVSPRELYIRQNNHCWLKPAVFPDGRIEIYCTDGEDEALTDRMLNPTIECVQCMVTFSKRLMKQTVANETDEDKSKSGENTSCTNI